MFVHNVFAAFVLLDVAMRVSVDIHGSVDPHNNMDVMRNTNKQVYVKRSARPQKVWGGGI